MDLFQIVRFPENLEKCLILVIFGHFLSRNLCKSVKILSKFGSYCGTKYTENSCFFLIFRAMAFIEKVIYSVTSVNVEVLKSSANVALIVVQSILKIHGFFSF